MAITGAFAVETEHPCLGIETCVIREDRAAVAHRTEILCGVETGGG
jgi:hypothetical protein